MFDPAAEREALQKRGDAAGKTLLRGICVVAIVPFIGLCALMAALMFPGMVRALAAIFGSLAVLVTGGTGTVMILAGALQKHQAHARLAQLDQLRLPAARVVTH